jgi:Flp pilus assembly protein TadD
MLLMWSVMLSGEINASIAPLQNSVQENPKPLQPHVALAMALDQTQHVHDAELEWRDALASDPHSTEALSGLAKDLSAEKDSGWIIALLGAHPDQLDSRLTLLLAKAYSDSGRLEDASRVLRTAAQADPSSVTLANALAGVLVMQSRKQEAEDVLQATLERHPADMGSQLLYLRLLVMNDDVVNARPIATRLLVSNAGNWEVQYLNGVLDRRARESLGTVLAKLKSPAAAKEQFEKAIALGSKDPEIRFELATVLKSLGESQAAEEQWKLYHQGAQTQSDLTQAAAKAAFADQRLAAGDVAQAVQLYREAVALAPKEASLAYKLGMALGKTGDDAGEKTALDQAVQIDPKMAEAQNQLGFLASRAGDTAVAEQRFRLAVAAAPEFVKAWINLAATLYLQSRLPEAKDAVHHALQLDPNNRQAQSLMTRLDSK